MQYKRAGIVLSSLAPVSAASLRLYGQADFERRHRLVKSIDELNLRYGRDVIRFAALQDSGGWPGLREAQRHLHSLGVTGWQDAIVGSYAGYPDPTGAYLASRWTGRRTVGRVELAVEQVLDHFEQGERARPSSLLGGITAAVAAPPRPR